MQMAPVMLACIEMKEAIALTSGSEVGNGPAPRCSFS